jgi:hypothetical protein
MGSSAPVAIVWCSESLPVIEVLLMLGTADTRRMVLLVADIGGAGEALPVVSTDANNGDAARVVVTNGGWGPLLAAETSMFSVSETEFGSIN